MGGCCERQVIKGEDFVMKVFNSFKINEFDYSSVADILIKNSSIENENKLTLDLTINNFLQLTEENFFDSNETTSKFRKFQIFFFTTLYENYSKDTYGLIFSLFSLVKNEKTKYIYFFQLLKRINTSEITFEMLLSYLEKFLQINLLGYSGYISNYNFGAEHEDSKSYVKNLIDSVYNPQNIKHFLEKVVDEFNKKILNGGNKSEHVMTEEEMKLIFEDNKYFFDFYNLRSYFISIYGQI